MKRVNRNEIEAHDWSLTPGRYVGVAPEEEDEDFDFDEALRSLFTWTCKGLNEEAAAKLAARIAMNFEELNRMSWTDTAIRKAHLRLILSARIYCRLRAQNRTCAGCQSYETPYKMIRTTNVRRGRLC